jgi:hypothetical protein
MARAPVSKTGGCRFESCHSCQAMPLKSCDLILAPFGANPVLLPLCYHLSGGRARGQQIALWILGPFLSCLKRRIERGGRILLHPRHMS